MVKAYEGKLSEFVIPVEELGFDPLVPTNTEWFFVEITAYKSYDSFMVEYYAHYHKSANRYEDQRRHKPTQFIKGFLLAIALMPNNET
jgi:hypothetical protein